MPDAPDLSRSIVLHFHGDWGQANLHRSEQD